MSFLLGKFRGRFRFSAQVPRLMRYFKNREGICMSDKLTAAIEALQEELEKQQSEVSDTKRMINGLRRRMGQPPLYLDEVEDTQSSNIRSSQFYGKPLATA